MLKYAQLILLALQGLLSLYQGNVGGFWNINEETRGQANAIDIFLEWSLTCTIIMGFYTMGLDVEKFVFVYENAKMVEKHTDSTQ